MLRLTHGVLHTVSEGDGRTTSRVTAALLTHARATSAVPPCTAARNHTIGSPPLAAVAP